MSEITFHQMAMELENEEVNVITTQGNFEGKLHSVGKDIIVVLQTRLGTRPVRVIIRIEEIVALFRAEQGPRGPFGFMGQGPDFNFDQPSESHDH